MIHEMREGSNYSKMTPEIQDAFNTKHIFQMGDNQTKMAAIRAVLDQNGMTDEAFVALTADEKTAMAADLKWMTDMNEIVMNAMSVGEMNFRTAVGYFDKEMDWSTAEKASFDEFMTEQWAKKVVDMGANVKRLNESKTSEGYATMTDAQKLAFNTKASEMMKME